MNSAEVRISAVKPFDQALFPLCFKIDFGANNLQEVRALQTGVFDTTGSIELLSPDGFLARKQLLAIADEKLQNIYNYHGLDYSSWIKDGKNILNIIGKASVLPAITSTATMLTQALSAQIQTPTFVELGTGAGISSSIVLKQISALPKYQFFGVDLYPTSLLATTLELQIAGVDSLLVEGPHVPQPIADSNACILVRANALDFLQNLPDQSVGGVFSDFGAVAYTTDLVELDGLLQEINRVLTKNGKFGATVLDHKSYNELNGLLMMQDIVKGGLRSTYKRLRDRNKGQSCLYTLTEMGEREITRYISDDAAIFLEHLHTIAKADIRAIMEFLRHLSSVSNAAKDLRKHNCSHIDLQEISKFRLQPQTILEQDFAVARMLIAEK